MNSSAILLTVARVFLPITALLSIVAAALLGFAISVVVDSGCNQYYTGGDGDAYKTAQSHTTKPAVLCGVSAGVLLVLCVLVIVLWVRINKANRNGVFRNMFIRIMAGITSFVGVIALIVSALAHNFLYSSGFLEGICLYDDDDYNTNTVSLHSGTIRAASGLAIANAVLTAVASMLVLAITFLPTNAADTNDASALYGQQDDYAAKSAMIGMPQPMLYQQPMPQQPYVSNSYPLAMLPQSGETYLQPQFNGGHVVAVAPVQPSHYEPQPQPPPLLPQYTGSAQMTDYSSSTAWQAAASPQPPSAMFAQQQQPTTLLNGWSVSH